MTCPFLFQMVTYDQAIELHRKLHEGDSKIFGGYSLTKHLTALKLSVSSMGIETVCDYGCGKAYGWIIDGYAELIGVKEVYLYDPCVQIYSELPSKNYDMIVCTDVLEHVPEESVQSVLSNIFGIATRFVYLSISTKAASKMLDANTNAHLCIQTRDWWIDKIEVANTNDILYNVSFD